MLAGPLSSLASIWLRLSLPNGASTRVHPQPRQGESNEAGDSAICGSVSGAPGGSSTRSKNLSTISEIG